jgi:hypothetical protein
MTVSLQPKQSMRYSRRPFPSYRFVPGKAPHPTRDPKGHSYGRDQPPMEDFGEHNWRETDAYLYGVDLFNHGYWWEAHESWEVCWVAAGRRTEIGLFVQGLIQISVACLKRHQGFIDVGQAKARQGLQKFPGNARCCLGIVVQELRAAVEASFFGDRSEPTVIRLKMSQN